MARTAFSHLAVTLALTLVSTTSALATETSLHMTSDPGDYIGGGDTYAYTAANGTFTLQGGPNNVSVYFYTPDFSHNWTLDFAAPSGQNLKPGVYVNAARDPFQDPNQPGLSVYGDGRGCNQLNGNFQIKQIQFAANGQPLALWATFEQHCEGNLPALRGDIRINANVLIELTSPASVSVSRGDTLRVEVQAKTQSGDIATLTATGLPVGAVFNDHGDNTGDLLWTPGIAQIGNYQVTFHGAAAGVEDSSSTQIRVTGQTLLSMTSDPADPVGHGQTFYFTPQVGTFAAQLDFGGAVNVTFTDPFTRQWHLGFRAPGGVPLTRGVYTGAVNFSQFDNTRPGLSVYGPSGSCGALTGSFTVKEITYGPGGTSINSFWATFEQHCGGLEPALRGDIRYNANVIVAVTSPSQLSVERGQHLALDVTATTVQAPRVFLSAGDLPAGATFTDHGNSTGTLDWTPGANQLGTYAVKFFGDDGAGGRDTSFTSIAVLGATSLTIQSDPGDNVARGTNYYVGRQGGIFRAVRNAANGVTVTVATPDFTTWELDFGSPMNQLLTPGSYEGAIHFPATDSRLPGMFVAPAFSGCDQLNGRFHVEQVVYGAQNDVTSFWATFEQQCVGATGGLKGEIRFNADVPLAVHAPASRDAMRGQLLSFDVSAYSSLGRTVTFAALHLPAGATFSDHGDNTGTFSWTPNVSGRFAVGFLADDGQGSVDSAFTNIMVQYTNHPPVAHVGGPYHGTAGVAIQFDGSQSSDPDRDPLTYSWYFGDNLYASGPTPTHVYAAPGAYGVTLNVYDGFSVAYDTTTVLVDPPLAARVFALGGNQTTKLKSGKAATCLQIEPVDQSFVNTDVDLSSITLSRTGARPGSISGDASLDRDRDHNGIDEISACFDKDSLRVLFQGIPAPGAQVQATVGGRLVNGKAFAGTILMAVEVARNTLTLRPTLGTGTPTQKLQFTTAADGPVHAEVFDLRGRKVCTLLDGDFEPAGDHELPFTGRSDHGDHLSPGIYFFRIRTKDAAVTGRVVLVQ